MDLDEILEAIRPVDPRWIQEARERTARLVMPPRALGRLHEISERLCGIGSTLEPSLDRKAFLVMAGDHGVVEEGVSAYPQQVTGEMVRTFLRQGAAINALASHVGAEVWVVDMGIVTELDPSALPGADRLLIHKIALGTANMARGPAMHRDQALKSVLTGFGLASELMRGGVDVLGTGEMGIGNTTPAAAIASVLTGKDPREVVGRGTGVDDEGLMRKIRIVERSIMTNRPDPMDALDVLTKVGGFEIGAIAGCILAGAYHRRPVVMDGFISTAGALIAQRLCPWVTDYLFAGHRSQEPGHGAMLQHLGLEPILDLEMRLGEGTGAALAMGIMEGALRIFREVLTFDEAGVSQKIS